LLVKEEARRSPGVTAFYSESMDSEIIRKKLTSLGISTAGGQGKLKGKIIRAAHYNDFSWTDICVFLSSLHTISGEDNSNFLEAAWQIWNGEE
ncbi:MAG: alanine--glyoxylate aminotransferase family protein, partial [Synergistaceae bacterium]